jgi:hypothetical protein
MPAPKTISGPTPDSPSIAIARLGVVSGQNDQVSDWVDVQFNPASLQQQVSNELKDTRNNERKQYIAKSNAKLTMELQFDTTDNGDDVTQTTRKLQAFIAPPVPAGQQARRQEPPPVVLFEWGRVKFKGIAETYKETIDFFSASGVPLRALVNLTLSRQDQVFDDAGGGGPERVGGAGDTSPFDAPAASAADVANAAQAPAAARDVAAANGQESLRFGSGASLTVGGSVELKPPAAFAAGGGLSVGVAAGASIGGGAGVSAIARLPATEGAFAALRVPPPSTAAARLNPARLQPDVRSATLSTDRNASFQVGGKATLEGAAGLRADVGARPSAGGRLTFDTL